MLPRRLYPCCQGLIVILSSTLKLRRTKLTHLFANCTVCSVTTCIPRPSKENVTVVPLNCHSAHTTFDPSQRLPSYEALMPTGQDGEGLQKHSELPGLKDRTMVTTAHHRPVGMEANGDGAGWLLPSASVILCVRVRARRTRARIRQGSTASATEARTWLAHALTVKGQSLKTHQSQLFGSNSSDSCPAATVLVRQSC
jgi:hypothetical protein